MVRFGLLALGLVTAGATGLSAQRQLSPISSRIQSLPPPTGITLSGSAPQITIAWLPVTGATDYAVLRSADATQPGTAISPAGLAALSFVDRTAAAATVYYYTIRARSAVGATSVSGPVRFDPPPAIVKSLTGTRLSTLNLGSTAPADNGLPAITGVGDTVITPGGQPVSIRGRNLWGIIGVYFGTGTPDSWSNPRFTPSLVSSAGDEVQVKAPAGCVTRGPVVLVQSYNPSDPGATTYITQAATPTASQVRLYCAAKPVIGGTISAGRPGGSGFFQGSYLSWVTQVTNLVDGAALSYRVVSDNQLSVDIPRYTSAQFPQGQVRFQPNLISRLGSTAASLMIFYLPPIVTSAGGPFLSPAQVTPVEPGGPLLITGYGLTGSGQTTVMVDGLPATGLSFPAPGTIAVTVPTGVTNGSFTVTTIGGSATGTVPVMGPSTLTGVSPANAPVGAQVTVTGQNFFRARGVCFAAAGSSSPQLVQSFVVGFQAPEWQQWTNNSVTVLVPANSVSGRLGLYLPSTPGATTGACVPGSAMLQVP